MKIELTINKSILLNESKLLKDTTFGGIAAGVAGLTAAGYYGDYVGDGIQNDINHNLYLQNIIPGGSDVINADPKLQKITMDGFDLIKDKNNFDNNKMGNQLATGASAALAGAGISYLASKDKK